MWLIRVNNKKMIYLSLLLQNMSLKNIVVLINMINFIFLVFSLLSLTLVCCVCPNDCGRNNNRGCCLTENEPTGKFCVCEEGYSGIDCSKISIIIII